MAGEIEEAFLKIAEGNSVLVEGGAGSGKEFFCRLLLRQALDAGHPVAVLSFHPEAHIAWFREYAKNTAGMVRYAEAPDNLTEMGIALNEHAKGARFAYIDFFEILSAKLDANDILDAVAFNARKLKMGKTSLMQAVSPESVEAKQMARLRELFDIVIEVRRKGDRMEYAFRKHPAEFEEEWHGFSLSEVFVPRRSIAEFCINAMEYELKNAGHYSRNLEKFDNEGRRILFNLSQASLKHFGELEELLKEVTDAAEPKPASTDELLKVLEEGLLEECVMEGKYREYSDEAGEKKAAAVFKRLSEDENAHALMVKRLKESISGKKE